MQNLLQLIHKFSSFIVFILLEVAAFMLIVYNSAYPKSTVLSTCNSIVAWHYEVENNIVSYFHLKEANEQLQQENAMLRNQIVLYANERERYKESENVYRYANLQHRFIPAKVIQMNMGGMKNYMTINKGERDGIQAEMGVIGPIGIVGIVSTVGKHFSLVIPVTTSLNFGVSCRLQKNSKLGTLKWDGKDEKHALLTEVESSVDVQPGDIILTSGLSTTFPENLPVGVVEKAYIKDGDAMWTIDVLLYTDFSKLSYVQVIDNNIANTELEQLKREMD
ncbi:MAG: rod shape-determining protein MreC [Paludibacteraceae bacterium]|jgi:rod shape-determining protein MreC|nr:rod shape-determining protein MreC [Paludibacteraceae bacterium]